MLQVAESCFLIRIRSAIRYAQHCQIFDAGFHRIEVLGRILCIQFSRPILLGLMIITTVAITISPRMASGFSLGLLRFTSTYLSTSDVKYVPCDLG